jgi:hypothetical protein
MPHFTVVPVDGPRRGDYDNLEGLSWVDYGERAEREDSDGEGARGWGLGLAGGGHAGPAAARVPRAHPSMRAQLFFLCAASTLCCTSAGMIFSAAGARAGPLSPLQLLPCRPRAGAADVAVRGSQPADRPARDSTEPGSLALPAGRKPGLQPLQPSVNRPHPLVA